MFYLQYGSIGRWCSVHWSLGNLPSHHQVDNGAVVELRRGFAYDHLAIAQYGYLVGDHEHFFDEMGDVYDSYA